MSRSKYVIAANSTFSWWGGFLASEHAAKVFLPDPWFHNWPEEVGDAFYFPNCVRVKSDFITETPLISDFDQSVLDN